MTTILALSKCHLGQRAIVSDIKIKCSLAWIVFDIDTIPILNKLIKRSR